MISDCFLGCGAVFSPFIGFLLGALAVRFKGDKFAQIATCVFMIAAVLCSLSLIKTIIFNHNPQVFNIATWISIEMFQVSWGIKLDTLSVVMMNVVTIVSCLVHIYSIGYMSHDASIPRFMSYLSLFTFMMMMLVTAPNLVQMFFGWEGVGLASYLLIGFWYERESANDASMKAFLVNRVGDVGLALGIFAIFVVFQTVQFDQIFFQLPNLPEGSTFLFWNWSVDSLNLIGILLFIGAMGKSAQLGLHTWLPDAMEGPTPVSALIHAATMVTAGVFMVARMSPLYELAPFARDIITVVGASTAFFAATIALTQTDIKRVIAYSTCSQLGYMFFAAGCSAYNAAIFHLVTHAFFKALLFLGAGSIIHAMSDEQDMKNMGGIYRLIPKTYAFMWIGSLALAGIPLFAGYYSKDAIIESAFLRGHSIGEFAFVIGLIVAFLTAFYSWRLLLLTFHGTPKADDHVMAHIHESPMVMLIPLAILSLGALFSGYMMHGLFLDSAANFWNDSIAVIPHAHSIPSWVIAAPLICAISGIGFAYLLYGGDRSFVAKVVSSLKPLYQLSYRKWYIDELYNFIFIKPSIMIGNFLWKKGDEKTIDRFGPDGIAKASLWTSGMTSRLQTGHIYHYAFAILIGIVITLTWYLFFYDRFFMSIGK